MSSACRSANFACVQQPRRLLLAPDVPLAGEEGRAAALQLEHGGRDGLEEPAVVRDEDHGRVDRRRAPARATRSTPCRGGSSARRGGAGRGRRRARGRARRASARRRRRSRGRGRGRRRRSRARAARRRRGRASRSRPRARAAPAPRRSGAASRARGRRPPSPPRGGAAHARPRRGRRRPRARTRAACEPPSARRPLVVQRDARALLPGELAAVRARVSPISARSSVVLPAPFGPASASRSRRSTLNETPSKSGSPESSLRSADAIRTAIAS